MDKEKTNSLIRPSWEHVYIYKKLKEKSKFKPYMRPKEVLRELKIILKIPPTLKYPILKQMEEEGLIKRVNHQKYEITNEEKAIKIKIINEKLKELIQVGRRNRMLKSMEECGLISKAKGTRFRILNVDCDKKLELLGDYTFW